MTVVVCTLHAHERPFDLPRSLVCDRARITGGERSLYELAFAAAASGHEVELRGAISESMFAELRDAAPGPAPRVGLEPRRPAADDVVVMPEAWALAQYAGPVLSDARVVMMVLAPPGLCGPSLEESRDPLTTPIDSVGQPKLFRAIAAVGFELWTNSPGTAAAAQAADVACTFLGTGTPLQFPAYAEKTHDIAVVESNRWRPFADIVASQVEDASCLRIAATNGWRGIPEALARARILIWPSRLEGDSRIYRESRIVGTVPVALPTAFTACLNEECGAVVVDTIEEMPGAIRGLLDRPDQLAELARRGVESARRQVDWPSYIARVNLALRLRPPDQSWRFRQLAGGSLDAVLRDHQREVSALKAQLTELETAAITAEQRAAEQRAELISAQRHAAELSRLRHRLADGVNDVVRKSPAAHRGAKALVSGIAAHRKNGRPPGSV